ncbi:MAG TPA: UDP-N-acetylmuramoyl-tripeptide--D-alanyl-D-alanine ligase [Rhodanobacteraceae bacterium]|nr:UDP-N-acetylmuramoyl-tripeptide--D-alanyl-D-alanine ligase [Rhodanobacteraceae bacterium]
MLKLRLADVALWTRGELRGEADVRLAGVSIDSRSAQPGDLFVALPGARSDGHQHVAAAAAAGASAALVMRWVDAALPQIRVDDSLLALGDLASAVRARRPARVVGITGSNGKTTVRRLVTAILTGAGPTHASAGNFNNEIGVPLTLLSLPAEARWAVVEMGAGKPGDIAYLAAMARPDVAVVTQIAPAHIERMGSLEAVAETKGALYAALPPDGVAIINADDAFAAQFAGTAGSRRQLRFGFGADVDVGAEALRLDADGSSFMLKTPLGDAPVALPLAGRHNIANALAAAAVGVALDVPLATIAAGLQATRAMCGRLRLRAAAGGARLIDDSYNANPGSLAAAIDTLALRPGERWLVLGDMAELGAEEIALHAQAGRQARAAGIDRLFAVGALSAHAVAAFGSDGEWFGDRNALAEALRARLHAGVTCLVKGSRSAGMDRVVAALATDDGEDAHAA